VADVLSGLGLTPHQESKKKILYNLHKNNVVEYNKNNNSQANIWFSCLTWLFSEAISIETVWCRMVGRLINLQPSLERELAEETDVLGENPLKFHFNHNKYLLRTRAFTLVSRLLKA
jgi:hypothetical protein